MALNVTVCKWCWMWWRVWLHAQLSTLQLDTMKIHRVSQVSTFFTWRWSKPLWLTGLLIFSHQVLGYQCPILDSNLTGLFSQPFTFLFLLEMCISTLLYTALAVPIPFKFKYAVFTILGKLLDYVYIRWCCQLMCIRYVVLLSCQLNSVWFNWMSASHHQ